MSFLFRRSLPATSAQWLHALEVLDHALRIRFESSEQPECAGGLQNSHAAARHGAAAERPRGAQEGGLDGEIDDFGDPQVPPQKFAT